MENPRNSRDRANVVCVDCHSRKVKCDLQNRADQICSNCRRLGHPCVRRDGVRKKRSTARTRSSRSASVLANNSPVDNDDTHLRVISPPISNIGPSNINPSSIAPSNISAGTPESRLPKGFISPSTVLHYNEPEQPSLTSTPSTASDMRSAILSLTKADILPRPSLLRALTDAYFEHVEPFYPIVDKKDVSDPNINILLQQAVCLVGGLTQHDTSNMSFVRSQYEKVKTLIYLNYETDHVVLLKSLCLITCYSVLPTNLVTLDGPWHWLGVAIRLAIQMGLHEDSTYDEKDKDTAESLRRIFWHLVNVDRMATSCWGRPSGFPPISSLDVRSLSVREFPTERNGAVFLKALELSAILEKMKKSNLGNTERSPTNLVNDLRVWLQNLPRELRLFYQDERQPFWKPAAELHIWYLAIVILLQLRDKDGFPWKIAPSSLIAASCIARLYEEIDCHEETVRLLHLHGLFCMIAAVPLICYVHTSQETRSICEEDIDVICRILQKMKCRYGGAGLVLTKIRHLQEEIRRDREATPQSHSNNLFPPMSASSSIRDRLDDLYPFPQSFCSALALHPVESVHESMEGCTSPLNDDEHLSLETLLAMDCTAFDLGVWESWA